MRAAVRDDAVSVNRERPVGVRIELVGQVRIVAVLPWRSTIVRRRLAARRQHREEVCPSTQSRRDGKPAEPHVPLVGVDVAVRRRSVVIRLPVQARLVGVVERAGLGRRIAVRVDEHRGGCARRLLVARVIRGRDRTGDRERHADAERQTRNDAGDSCEARESWPQTKPLLEAHALPPWAAPTKSGGARAGRRRRTRGQHQSFELLSRSFNGLNSPPRVELPQRLGADADTKREPDRGSRALGRRDGAAGQQHPGQFEGAQGRAHSASSSQAHAARATGPVRR